MYSPSSATASIAALVIGAPLAAIAQDRGEERGKVFSYPAQYNGQSFTATVQYEPANAWVGNDNFSLTITIETIGSKVLELVECDRCGGADSPIKTKGALQLVEDGTPARDRPWKRTYHLDAPIKSDIDPRQYDIALRFASPRASSGNVPDSFTTFPLYVGVREKGNLKVEESGSVKPELCMSERHRFTLRMKNGFRNYDVHLQKLTIGSEPNGLVTRVVRVRAGDITTQPSDADPLAVTFDPTFAIGAAQNEDLAVEVEMASMSWSTFLSGFGDDQRATFSLVYDDGWGRKISDYRYERPIRLQPGRGWLGFSVGLGVVAGIFLMSAWKLLSYEGALWRKVSLVVTTVLIGLITAVVALAGELNIALFNIRASTDKPMMLFVLSLVATVLGTPLLKKYLGLEKNTGNAAPAGQG
jgi:hypothetical protein